MPSVNSRQARVSRVSRPRWIRYTAYGCLLFLFLASSRGLIPGLCANLRALNEASASACAEADAALTTGHSCCAGMPAKKSPANDAPAPPGKRDCAFCELAGGRMLPLVAFVFEKPAPVRTGFLAPAITAPVSRYTPDAVRGRAPPSLPLAA